MLGALGKIRRRFDWDVMDGACWQEWNAIAASRPQTMISRASTGTEQRVAACSLSRPPPSIYSRPRVDSTWMPCPSVLGLFAPRSHASTAQARVLRPATAP
jgi:hypothetical protein